ncbi:uncharacterized protein [Haliotis asinina]|uniref:uncharacterized protein isoform X1 n=1 Tax=Haliotis asinina TaxID=109174 RepID=UPI0035327C3C
MASSDDVACSIYREILEKFLDQCCANKELASKLKLLRDQRETRKRFGDDVDEGIDSRPNSGSVGSAGRDSNVSIVMRIRELGGELKSVIDTVLKECEDSESLQAGALTIPEQDHELHNPPCTRVIAAIEDVLGGYGKVRVVTNGSIRRSSDCPGIRRIGHEWNRSIGRITSGI